MLIGVVVLTPNPKQQSKYPNTQQQWYPYGGILYSNENKQTTATISHSLHESHTHSVERKNPDKTPNTIWFPLYNTELEKRQDSFLPLEVRMVVTFWSTRGHWWCSASWPGRQLLRLTEFTEWKFIEIYTLGLLWWCWYLYVILQRTLRFFFLTQINSVGIFGVRVRSRHQYF